MRTRTLVTVAVLAVIGLGAWLLRSRVAEEETGTLVPLRDTGHPVLLLVDAEGLRDARPADPRERWFDLEWDNVLTQALGGCDVADRSALPDVLERRQLVVIPRRTAARFTPEEVEWIGQRVATGLEVLVEAPDTLIARRVGLLLAAVERRPLLPWPRPQSRSGLRAPELRARPLAIEWTRLRYGPAPGSGANRPRVRSSLDGRPLAWAKAEGAGTWHLLAMDFAELSARLREFGSDTRAFWLDAWVEGICGAPLTRQPIPRIAAAPPDHDGWLVAADAAATGPPGGAGTDAPYRQVSRSGRASDSLILPAPTFDLADSTAGGGLDRRLRRNAAGGGGPLLVAATTGPDSTLPESVVRTAERHRQRTASPDQLLAWWEARSGVRLRAEGSPKDLAVTVERLPPAESGFGLLVPVRWGDLTLAGWEAQWGLAPGRRVQRFERGYRVIALGPAAEGKVIRLRYR